MASRKIDRESCEQDRRKVSGHDALEPVGGKPSPPKNAPARGRNVAKTCERKSDTESDRELPVTRARSRVRDVTKAAHDTTSESDVDLEDVQATRDRAVHMAKQNSASSCAVEPCVRPGGAPSAPDSSGHRDTYAIPPVDGVRVEPVSEKCKNMHFRFADHHTDEQIENAKEAFNAVVLAFGEQHAAPIEEDSSVIAASPERRLEEPTPARRPDTLPVQPALPARQTPATRQDPRRPRGRFTRVVNIVNVNDSPSAAKQMYKNRAAGDSVVAAPEVARSYRKSQPLETNDDRGPRSGSTSPAAQTNARRKYGEGKLRLPLFDGHDWPGFIKQFEACVRYYKWSDHEKAMRLAMSMVGEARLALMSTRTPHWSYATLRKHLEARFGKCTRYAQTQTELFAVKREPDQSLQEFYDAICSIADTANVTAAESEKLVYTAFMHGLRTNQHMHS